MTGGTAVTIYGTGLDDTTVQSVSLGGNTYTPGSGSGKYAVAAATGSQPATLTLTTVAGATGTTDTTVTYIAGVGYAAGITPTSTADRFTYYAPVAISPSASATLVATYNQSYSQTFMATGGSGSYTLTNSGTPPPGLVLNNSGSNWTLSGMPTATGSYSFSLTATDTTNSTNVAAQSYTMSVQATPVINIGLPNPQLAYGQSGTISVTLAPPTGLSTLPGGTITYSVDGGTASTLGLSGGRASIPVPSSLTVGDHTLAVSYSGDQNYFNLSGMDVTLEIGKASATLTLGGLNATYDGSAHPATATTVPAGLSVSVTYNGSPTVPSMAGTYTVVGTINDTNYTGSATGTLTINKATATVTFGSLSATYNGSMHAATATTVPAGLPVSLTYNGSSTAPTTAGTYTVVGTINDTNYTGSATGTLTVSKATAAVTLGNLNQTYTGSLRATTATTTPTGLSVSLTYNGSTIPPTAAGSYPIAAMINDPNYTGTATGTLVIAKAGTTTSLSGNGANLTVHVASTAGTPTGLVNLYDSASLLTSVPLNLGSATYTISFIDTTAHSVTAVYVGDTNFNTSTSTPLSVTPPPVVDFTLTDTNVIYQTVIPGASTSFTYNLSPAVQGTYPGPVSFTVSGLPQGATYTISPSTVATNAGPQTITLLVATAPAAMQGRVAPGSKGQLAWALLLLPLVGTRRLRRSGKRIQTLMAIAVFLLVGGVGLVTMMGCGSGNGFFGQAPQNYSVTVTATAGTVQHASTVTLNVQ